MRRALYLLLVLSITFSMTLGVATAQETSPAVSSDGDGLLAQLGYPELALSTDGEGLDVPTEIEAGRYHLTLSNTGSDLSADVELYQPPEGMTSDDLLTAFEEVEVGPLPEWFYELVSGGGVTAAPGETADVILDLTPGEWVFNLYTYDEKFTTAVNTPTDVTVTGERPALDDPEAAVEATMVDYDFEISALVPAGANVWKIANEGNEPHHLILSQVPEGTTEDDVLELVMTLFGAPAGPVAATPEGSVSPAEPALAIEAACSRSTRPSSARAVARCGPRSISSLAPTPPSASSRRPTAPRM
ncbi:MAG TPA: hypothetical protein VD789_01835 [Thermomicrobiales bacterium]|nr:hypothetical protein [Thermomicrobiales bacterium]